MATYATPDKTSFDGYSVDDRGMAVAFPTVTPSRGIIASSPARMVANPAGNPIRTAPSRKNPR